MIIHPAAGSTFDLIGRWWEIKEKALAAFYNKIDRNEIFERCGESNKIRTNERDVVHAPNDCTWANVSTGVQPWACISFMNNYEWCFFGIAENIWDQTYRSIDSSFRRILISHHVQCIQQNFLRTNVSAQRTWEVGATTAWTYTCIIHEYTKIISFGCVHQLINWLKTFA